MPKCIKSKSLCKINKIDMILVKKKKEFKLLKHGLISSQWKTWPSVIQFKFNCIKSIKQPGNTNCVLGFPGGAGVKNPPANAEDAGSIPESGRSPRKGNGNPLQYSCLKNPMDRGTWRATAHGVSKESDETEWLNVTIFHGKKKCLRVLRGPVRTAYSTYSSFTISTNITHH